MNQEDVEKAIKILKEHHDHWMRLHEEGICTEEEGENTIEALEVAIEALEQMPVTTTAGEWGVIYYPQVEGVTPTVIDAGKQEPCDTCGYEEGSIYCKEHCPHEANIEQELTEFEEIDFMQEHKKIPVTLDLTSCKDAISRENAIIRISWDFPTLEISKVKESLDKLPPVTPQPKWIPVGERLPKIADVYRVTRYYPNNVMNPNYLVDACFFDGSNTWYNDNRINHERDYANNVIAWQENPEPYEPQERNGKK